MRIQAVHTTEEGTSTMKLIVELANARITSFGFGGLAPGDEESLSMTYERIELEYLDGERGISSDLTWNVVKNAGA